MQLIGLISALLSLALWQAIAAPDSRGLRRLQAKVAVEAANARPSELAGRYSSTPQELRRLTVPFTGSDLYLFPDGTYIYTEWGCLEPQTIYDKGEWKLAEGLLILSSDPDVKWPTILERRSLIIRRARLPHEIIVVGLERRLRYFEKHAKKDPEFMLLLVGLVRDEVFSEESAAKTRAMLLEEAWRPEYFQSDKE